MARPTWLAVFALAVLGGCPESQELPERPSGPTCETDLDCVPDGEPACGVLRACVDARCELEPTVLVPCP